MKRSKIFLLLALGLVAGCQRNTQSGVEYVDYVDTVEYNDGVYVTDCAADNAPAGKIKYSVPRDGDLTLETRHHIIQVSGNPGTEYEYRVWAGDKSYDDDPDLIVNDGTVMVLTQN